MTEHEERRQLRKHRRVKSVRDITQSALNSKNTGQFCNLSLVLLQPRMFPSLIHCETFGPNLLETKVEEFNEFLRVASISKVILVYTAPLFVLFTQLRKCNTVARWVTINHCVDNRAKGPYVDCCIDALLCNVPFYATTQSLLLRDFLKRISAMFDI